MARRRDLWSYVDKNGPDGCWIWLGAKIRSGYGMYSRPGPRKGRMVPAHRYIYELAKGEIPTGLQLDHTCPKRRHDCVNPDHVEPVTQAVNILRGMAPTIIAHRAGTCTRGHPTQGPCRVCAAEYNRRPERREARRLFMQRSRARQKAAA